MGAVRMLIWFLLGLMVGLLLFLFPLLIGDKLPFALRTRLANIYYDISMRLFGRLVFCTRKHGGVVQYSSGYDEAKSAEKIYFGKNEAYFDDPFGAVHHLYHRPCMFVHESISCIYDPRLSVIGERIQKMVRAGKHQQEFSDKDGKSFVAYCGYVFVPKVLNLINLKSALAVIPGGADPLLASTTKKFIELSQKGYQKVPFMELGIGILFFIAGYGLSALTVYYLDKNPIPSGIEVNLPIWLGGLI